MRIIQRMKPSKTTSIITDLSNGQSTTITTTGTQNKLVIWVKKILCPLLALPNEIIKNEILDEEEKHVPPVAIEKEIRKKDKKKSRYSSNSSRSSAGRSHSSDDDRKSSRKKKDRKKDRKT